MLDTPPFGESHRFAAPTSLVRRAHTRVRPYSFFGESPFCLAGATLLRVNNTRQCIAPRKLISGVKVYRISMEVAVYCYRDDSLDVHRHR